MTEITETYLNFPSHVTVWSFSCPKRKILFFQISENLRAVNVLISESRFLNFYYFRIYGFSTALFGHKLKMYGSLSFFKKSIFMCGLKIFNLRNNSRKKAINSGIIKNSTDFNNFIWQSTSNKVYWWHFCKSCKHLTKYFANFFCCEKAKFLQAFCTNIWLWLFASRKSVAKNTFSYSWIFLEYTGLPVENLVCSENVRFGFVLVFKNSNIIIEGLFWKKKY